eukprot:g30859.t1
MGRLVLWFWYPNPLNVPPPKENASELLAKFDQEEVLRLGRVVQRMSFSTLVSLLLKRWGPGPFANELHMELQKLRESVKDKHWRILEVSIFAGQVFGLHANLLRFWLRTSGQPWAPVSQFAAAPTCVA